MDKLQAFAFVVATLFANDLEPCTEIERVSWQSSLKNLIDKQVPFIATDSQLLNLRHWSKHKLLTMFDQKMLNVKVSKTHNFRYFDESKASGDFHFTPPYVETAMSMESFYSNFSFSEEYLYLYTSLNLDNASLELFEEIKSWNWDWVKLTAKENQWKMPQQHALLIAMENNTTPPHYDMQHNLLQMISGEKEVILFPPTDINRMYTFPYEHPCERQSMVSMENPQFDKFPKFEQTRGMYGKVKEGEILYIPVSWFHNVKNLKNYTTAITFWFEDDNPLKVDDVYNAKTPMKRSKFLFRKNIQSVLKRFFPKENINDIVFQMLRAFEGEVSVPKSIETLLETLESLGIKNPQEFIVETLQGRFNINHQEYV